MLTAVCRQGNDSYLYAPYEDSVRVGGIALCTYRESRVDHVWRLSRLGHHSTSVHQQYAILS